MTMVSWKENECHVGCMVFPQVALEEIPSSDFFKVPS